MPGPKLTTERLSKTFYTRTGEVEALRDLTASIQDGEFVSVVGASGCGKSTLLRLLDGLIQPTSGSVTIDGRPVSGPGPDRGFVFQYDGLMPWRSILSNTLLGPEVQRRPRDVAGRAAREFLSLVGLSGFERFYPHELSGGMRQRVNLARAFTVGPDVLLMDEPFAALDAQTREIMQAELLRIWSETRKTVVFVTHQIDEAVYLSDRVLVLTVRPGRLKEELVIELPRPRNLSVKRTPRFAEYTDRIWQLIESEVRESMQLEVEQAASRAR